MDKYTKVVLTLIALALWANLAVSLTPPGRGLIRDANAQGAPQRVTIASVEMGYLPVTVANRVLLERGSYPMPVFLIADPTGANPPPGLPGNLSQIGAKTFQQGVVLPVDIEGIAGAAVKSSGLPVAVASSQPLTVTATNPLPVTLASTQPVAVTAKDPLQVTVIKLPPPPPTGQTNSMQSPPPASSGTSGM